MTNKSPKMEIASVAEFILRVLEGLPCNGILRFEF